MKKLEHYEEKIKPLMDQVEKLCIEHGISAIYAFALPDRDQPFQGASAIIRNGDGIYDERFVQCLPILKRKLKTEI